MRRESGSFQAVGRRGLNLLPLAGIFPAALLGAWVGVSAVATPDAAQAQAPASTPSAAADRCTQLTGRQIGDGTVEKAEFVPAGSKLVMVPDPTSFGFCRVTARTSSGPASTIKVAVWLPEQWNGKMAGLGGGGYSGGFASADVSFRGPVSKGYATLATDAGHDTSAQAEWALGHPEKIEDYGHRANHQGALFGKALVAAYYGAPAKRAYFHGCSNGGRDALMLAQRYPGDYDAIAVGAPANDFTGLISSFVQYERLFRVSPGVTLTPAKLKLLHDAAIAKCDGVDGAKDGLIENPRQCRFDPAALSCKPGGQGECLTSEEVGIVRHIYSGIRLRNGYQVMPGLPVGSEYEWNAWLTGPKAAGGDLGVQLYRYMLFNDPKWQVSSFDINRDYPLARKKLGPIIDAVDPNLRPFFRKGGKLLMYHGWDDAAIPAGNTLRYYAAMRRTVGAKAADASSRLFMMPGVGHCAGGHGPDNVDFFAELDRWKDSGKAPDQLIAAKGDNILRSMVGLPTKTLRSRPLCVYPKTAHYKGAGSLDEAASFLCR